MRKIIIIISLILLLSGCQNINKSSISDVVENSIKSNNLANQYRQGYKYYLPRGLTVESNLEYNEKLSSRNNNYYLYIDFVSYHNKKKSEYEVNNTLYHSQKIEHGDNFGYLEIKELENKLYVEMMYNYAKIEIVTNKEYLNEVVYKMSVLLSSIKYNDVIIEKKLKNELSSYRDVPYNIFKPKENPTNFLDYDEDNDGEKIDNKVPDYDLIQYERW